MFMSYYFAPTANALIVFEAVSLCPYVAIISYVNVNVRCLAPTVNTLPVGEAVFLLTQIICFRTFAMKVVD